MMIPWEKVLPRVVIRAPIVSLIKPPPLLLWDRPNRRAR